MADDDGGGIHLEIPRSVFSVMLLGAMGLGAGGMGVFNTSLETGFLESCVENSKTAISVAAQHGQELIELRADVSDKIDRTVEVETRAVEKRHAEFERRINAIERQLDNLSR